MWSDTAADGLICAHLGGTELVTNVLGVVVIDDRINAYLLPNTIDFTNLGTCIATQLGEETDERVTVRFEPRDDATEVIVVHERIASPGAREGHEHGWIGCLDGLDAFFARGPRRSPHMQ